MARRQVSVRWAVGFIFVTVLLNSIGFGIILPVLPELIVDITGDPVHEAARYGGWLAFAYASMQFIFSPMAGNLSDRFGRCPVLLVSLFVFGIDYLIMGLAPTLAWLFVGRLIAGTSGATYGIANACIADLFPPDKRAQNFGLIGAAFGVGFILGPVIGGFLGEFGPRTPFFVTAGIAFANALFGLLVIPETLKEEDRRPFRFGRANPLGAFRQMGRFPVVAGILGAYFLYMMAHDSLPAVWAFYTMDRYGWGPRDVGFSLGVVGVCMLVVQGFLIRKIIPLWGSRRTAYVGLMLAAVAFFGYALSPVGWAMYMWIVIGAGSGLIIPAMNGIMSRQIPANAQGALQGLLGSVASSTFIFSPVMMTQLFAYFSSPAAPVYFPGAAFALAGVLTAGSALVMLVALSRISYRE
ncbi:MAG: TCR/Tet family MFS transporter [Gammaproteobacteria bacterium]|nr:TCR/Tet family MFS transporter [Gammaproteobacteria bacterium]